MSTSLFQRKWTDEQREAVVFAVLDAKPRLSCPKAAEAAAAGLIPKARTQELLPAFEMPTATIREYMQAEKKKREGYKLHPLTQPERNSLESIEAITRRAISAMAWKTEEWGAKGKNCDPAEAEKVLRTLKLAAELEERMAAAKAAGNTANSLTERKSKREPSTAERLAKAARKEQDAEKPGGPAPKPHALRDANHAQQASYVPPEGAEVVPQGAERVLTHAGSPSQGLPAAA